MKPVDKTLRSLALVCFEKDLDQVTSRGPVCFHLFCDSPSILSIESMSLEYMTEICQVGNNKITFI